MPFTRHIPVIASGAAVFDPATLALTGWWRANSTTGYTAGTMLAVASAGASGSNGNLTQATGANQPAVGAALNGHNTADYDGTNDTLGNSNAMTTFFDASAGSLAVLFRADTAIADPGSGQPYNIPYLVGDTNAGVGGSFAAGFTDSGFRVGFWDSSSWDSVAVAASTGAYHLGQAKWNGSNLFVRVDGGSWTSFARLGWDNLGAYTLLSGANYNSATFFDGRVAEIILSDTIISDANFDSIKSYVNSRYALSL